MSQTNPPSGPPSDPPSGSTDRPNMGQENKRSVMDENQDIGIGSPSADAAYYGYENESGSLPIILMGFGAVVVTVVIAGLVYLAYMKGLEDGQSSTPPVLLADNEPVKVKPDTPDSRPENDNLNIYTIMTEDDPQAETDSQEPGTGAVESLVYDNASGNEAVATGDDLASRDAAIEAVMGDAAEKTDDIGALVAKLNDAAETTDDNIMQIPQSSPQSAPQSPPKPAPERQPAIVESLTTPVVQGDYIIQLLSVRTAEQASNEFKRIARKYTDLIGDREPLIIPRDLGEKGTYYRVNIAGFESSSAANSLCDRLKERGQDCLVRKAP